MLGKNYWFVSHCSKDVYVVNQLVNILKTCNISYWKAPEMIPAGSNYAREIPNALKNCDIFLFATMVSEFVILSHIKYWYISFFLFECFW